MTFAQQNGHVKGGWQGGRGWQVDGSKINSTDGDYLLAGGWMLEGALELLDAPNEYFWDPATHTLFLWPNATTRSAPTPPTGTFVVVNLHTLVNLNSTPGDPISNVTIEGLSFRDAADISMMPWGVPSGGDCMLLRLYMLRPLEAHQLPSLGGLHRGGAVFLEGTRDCVVMNCKFERLDGNAVFVSGFNRNATVQDSEFSWLGHSAAAAWGYTNGVLSFSCPLSSFRLHEDSRAAIEVQRKTGLTGFNHTIQTSFETTCVRLVLFRNNHLRGSRRRRHNLLWRAMSFLTGDHPYPLTTTDETITIRVNTQTRAKFAGLEPGSI